MDTLFFFGLWLNFYQTSKDLTKLLHNDISEVSYKVKFKEKSILVQKKKNFKSTHFIICILYERLGCTNFRIFWVKPVFEFHSPLILKHLWSHTKSKTQARWEVREDRLPRFRACSPSWFPRQTENQLFRREGGTARIPEAQSRCWAQPVNPTVPLQRQPSSLRATSKVMKWHNWPKYMSQGILSLHTLQVFHVVLSWFVWRRRHP